MKPEQIKELREFLDKESTTCVGYVISFIDYDGECKVHTNANIMHLTYMSKRIDVLCDQIIMSTTKEISKDLSNKPKLVSVEPEPNT